LAIPAAQTRRCLEIVNAAIRGCGRLAASRRAYAHPADAHRRLAGGRRGAHGEFFRDIRPTNTIMQITRFIDPEWLVEIEADAIVEDMPSLKGIASRGAA
jgi:enamine deaminase RidA (YjgF/YER057c/UK114 family)